MNPEPAVLEPETIADPVVADSPADDLEGISTDALDDVAPVANEVIEEKPKSRTLEELSDDEVLGNERVKELLRRNAQSERDRALAEQAKEQRRAAAEYIQRGGFAQTLNQVLQQAIESADGAIDGRAIQAASNNLYTYLATENWNKFSGAVAESMPKDASLPQELVSGLQKAADNLLSGRGAYEDLVKEQLKAYRHAILEEERPKIAREEERKLRERLKARSATDQMRAADAGRTGEPTNVTSGLPPKANIDDILRSSHSSSAEYKAAYKSKHGVDPWW
jgi:DNA-binding transcriptional regulator YbjK